MSDQDNSQIFCRRCGMKIGQYVMVERDEMVQVGGLLVAELHGNCIQCGEEFHYSLNAKRLERLIRRVNRSERPKPAEPGVELR